MLKGKKIVLGISGGIAAYKAIELCSMLKKSGAEVKVVLTENAGRFVSELPLQVLSGNPVFSSLWDKSEPIPHIHLADWADLIVIAPATANVLSKAAAGLGDDLMSATLLAAHCPILMVPAMNINMYNNPAVKQNISILQTRGYILMEPEEGNLACGYSGKGRYPQNEEILYYIKALCIYPRFLAGKKILITAGACRERIDPMRFISNNSTGKMGIALARAAHILGARVSLILAYTSVTVPEHLRVVEAETAAKMLKACQEEFPENDLLIMCAAVSDYRPEKEQAEKIKKAGNLRLDLVRTEDILKSLSKKPDQRLCGFAAESNNEHKNAEKKLKEKQLNYIVSNNLSVAGREDTSCDFITADNKVELSGAKFEVALKILAEINNLEKYNE